MRKVICFFAILSLIFSGCSDMTVSDQIPRTFSSQQNVVLEDDINGLFISDSNGFLKFLDFYFLHSHIDNLRYIRYPKYLLL